MGINNLLELYHELKKRSGFLGGLNYREAAILQYVEEQIYNQITPKAVEQTQMDKAYTGQGEITAAIPTPSKAYYK